MLTAPENWEKVWKSGADVEFYAMIGGVRYEMDQFQSVKAYRAAFSNLSIGQAVSAQLTISFMPTVQPPRTAKIELFARLTNQRDITTDWVPQGTYYTDTREMETGILETEAGLGTLTINAYDRMMFAEEPYSPLSLMWDTINKLPPGYTRLKYIESTGTQYIDAGFVPSDQTEVLADIDIASDNDPISGVFGSKTSEYGFTDACCLRTTEEGFQDDYYESTIQFSKTVSGRHKIRKKENLTKIDNRTVEHPEGEFKSGDTFLVFGVQIGRELEPTCLLKAKLYSFKIFDYGEPVRDFIPCQAEDGRVCLYDTVSGGFFENVGTGEFTPGPPADGDSEMRYISATVIVNDICARLGVPLDSRSKIDSDLMVSEPENLTMRDVLRNIAAAHGGNFIITPENKLLLLQLEDIPELSLLVDEHKNFITDEYGTRILLITGENSETQSVFQSIASPTPCENAKSLSNQVTFSKVSLRLDSENTYEAGDDTGYILSADCLYADGAAAKRALARVKDVRYDPAELTEAKFYPLLELGDAVYSVGNLFRVYQMSIDYNLVCSAELSAPTDGELDHEIPYQSASERMMDQKIEEAASKIGKSISEIKDQIDEVKENLDSLLVESGVVSFNGRTGVVVPEKEDYQEFIDESIREAIYESWKASY